MSLPYFETGTWKIIHAINPDGRPYCGLWLPRLHVTRWLGDDEMDADDLWGKVCCNCLRGFDYQERLIRERAHAL